MNALKYSRVYIGYKFVVSLPQNEKINSALINSVIDREPNFAFTD